MPTRGGWVTGAAAVALVAGGFLLGYPAVVAVGMVGLLGLALAVVFVARVPTLDVTIHVEPARVPRGEASAAVVTLRGTRRGGRLPGGSHRAHRAHRGGVRGLLVDVPIMHSAAGGMLTTVRVRRSQAGKEISAVLPLPTRRRGELQVGPAVLRVADPFGLAERRVVASGTATAHVHPATVALPAPVSSRVRSPEGPLVDVALEGTITFRALRAYAPGDDLRRVHWRSSARVGTLLVRENIDPPEPRSTVLLDVRRAAYASASPHAVHLPAGGGPAEGSEEFEEFEEFEAAVDVAASVAFASCSAGFAVRLATSAGVLTESRGRRVDGQRLLDVFARVQQDGGTSFAKVSSELSRREEGGPGQLTLITGPAGTGQLTGMGSLVGRFERVVVIHVGGGARGDEGSGNEQGKQGKQGNGNAGSGGAAGGGESSRPASWPGGNGQDRGGHGRDGHRGDGHRGDGHRGDGQVFAGMAGSGRLAEVGVAGIGDLPLAWRRVALTAARSRP